MFLRKSIRYNQNFFKDADLVTAVVRQANFTPSDTVYEIGPGMGIITRELAKTAGEVIAVELDRRLFLRLENEFAGNPRVRLINADFLTYRISDQSYKVFSNIPFNLTADIVRKLLADQKLAEAYLVVQKEAAEKFIGVPKETQFSILNKPWFELAILRRFRREDFVPQPSVDTVLLKIVRRPEALVDQKSKDDYFWFVQLGFNRWRANLGKNLKEIFTYNQWRRLASDLKFKIKAQPSDLTFAQWLGIFKFYLMVK